MVTLHLQLGKHRTVNIRTQPLLCRIPAQGEVLCTWVNLIQITVYRHPRRITCALAHSSSAKFRINIHCHGSRHRGGVQCPCTQRLLQYCIYLSRTKSLQNFEKKLRHCYENKNENEKNQRQLWLISAALSDFEILLGGSKTLAASSHLLQR